MPDTIVQYLVRYPCFPILKEHIALAEARRLSIPTFAMVDTNSNPKLVDFPIPANDDATKSITLIMDQICEAIREGFAGELSGLLSRHL